MESAHILLPKSPKFTTICLPFVFSTKLIFLAHANLPSATTSRYLLVILADYNVLTVRFPLYYKQARL